MLTRCSDEYLRFAACHVHGGGFAAARAAARRRVEREDGAFRQRSALGGLAESDPGRESQNELLSDRRISAIVSGKQIENSGNRTALLKPRRNRHSKRHECTLPTAARKSPRLGNAQCSHRGMPGGICWLPGSVE